MRTLASIQEIRALRPIPGADAIECATVLGWECVVKKGAFRVGDFCVYIEIDSVCPKTPAFAFMAHSGHRVRTIKLRGQVSQGLALPISDVLPSKKYKLGQDVTKEIGITKYDPEPQDDPAPTRAKKPWLVRMWWRIKNALHMGRKVSPGSFPSFLHKTDETRIQSCPEVLVRHVGEMWYVTEKLDGSSVTMYLKGAHFGVCSRNLEIARPLPGKDVSCSIAGKAWGVARSLNIEEKLRGLGRQIAIQGELIGPGIQGNKYKLKALEWRPFYIYDIKSKRYLPYEEARKIVDLLGLNWCPVVSERTTITSGLGVGDIVNWSKGESLLAPVHREGVVWRQLTGAASFKAINPDFLLAHKL